MSACDTCGGACCRFVVVGIGDMTPDQRRWAEMRGPLDFAHEGALLWRLPVACPNLTPAGRCGIYDTRPDVCRELAVDGALCRRAREYYNTTKEANDGKA